MVEYDYFDGQSIPAGVDRCLYSSPGETEQITYVEGVDEDGQPCLFPSGKVDLVELHQADKDNCDVALLIKRYQSGDLSALNQNAAAFYADVRQMPHDMIQAQNIRLAAEHFFASLPVDLKAAYDNNFYKWFEAFQAGEEKALAPFRIQEQQKTESEVTGNVSEQE